MRRKGDYIHHSKRITIRWWDQWPWLWSVELESCLNVSGTRELRNEIVYSGSSSTPLNCFNEVEWTGKIEVHLSLIGHPKGSQRRVINLNLHDLSSPAIYPRSYDSWSTNNQSDLVRGWKVYISVITPPYQYIQLLRIVSRIQNVPRLLSLIENCSAWPSSFPYY